MQSEEGAVHFAVRVYAIVKHLMETESHQIALAR